MQEYAGTKNPSGKVIGLTGGIASGKSTATVFLEKMGCISLDADKIGHEVYLKGMPAYSKILNTFGLGVMNKHEEIDRQKLGQIVFADKKMLDKLCKIVWPEIKTLGIKKISHAKQAHPHAPIVLEAAVLLEANWESMVDEVWVIYIDPKLAIQRLMQRNGLSFSDADARLKAQMTNAERLTKADKSYENKGSTEALETALKHMLYD